MALNEKKYHDASLRPPRHGPSADAHRPASCLLDFTAYIADRTNDTTASCEARGGSKIQVTFFFVHPPGVSHLCVYCPGLPPTEFACEPTVVATEADLILIRVVFGPYDNVFNLEMNDLCIYRAGSGERPPSLRHIPHPRPFFFFQDYQLGLLPRYEEEADLCYITALHNIDGRRRRRHRKETLSGPFQIHVFSSKTGHWIAKPTILNQRWHDELNRFHSTKVVTIGGEGGAVAWVDLWQGLLQCNVLDGIPQLHYVPLPPPLLPEKTLSGSPWLSRDIAVIQGRIKYIELQIRLCPGTNADGQYISDGWTAVAWSRTATNPWEEDDWHEDSKVDSDNVSADPFLLDQLPKLQDSSGRPEPTLKRLHAGQPTISLHHPSVVYFMTKVADWDDDSWVLAIDMTKGMLQQVAKFNAERTLGISFSFVHSRVSNYLSMEDPGSRQRDGEVMHRKEVFNKLLTTAGVSNFKSIICVASWDELMKLCSAPVMPESNNDMPCSATSMSNNEPPIFVVCRNELSDDLSIVPVVDKSNSHSDMFAARRDELLDMLRTLAAHGDELCNRFPTIFNYEPGTTSASIAEHSNNLPTEQCMFYYDKDKATFQQVYADKATGAKTGGPVAEVHQNMVAFGPVESMRYCEVLGWFAIYVAFPGLTVNTYTADPAMVFFHLVLMYFGLAFLLITASSKKMSTLVVRLISSSYRPSILDTPIKNN